MPIIKPISDLGNKSNEISQIANESDLSFIHSRKPQF
jgi:hypothetical protein